MSLYHKFLSYLNVIPVRKYESVYNGTLEINWLNGRKVLDTRNTNYSYGNLGKVLHKADPEGDAGRSEPGHPEETAG